MRQGRPCHRWWARGKRRPPGIRDRRRDWACLFGAARPDGEAAFALVLPAGNTAMMRIFLDRVAGTPAGDEPAVMGLDGAGWHGARALAPPPNVTLAPVPPQSPQLAPMERAWLRLPERFLSLRVPDGHEAIVDTCCIARTAIADNAERIRSPCLYPWIEKVIGHARRYQALEGRVRHGSRIQTPLTSRHATRLIQPRRYRT